MTESDKAKLTAKLTGIPKVGTAEAEVSNEFELAVKTSYSELSDDETVLYMLLKALECYGENKILPQPTIDDLSRDVFRVYLAEIGQASAGLETIAAPVRGRIQRRLGEHSETVFEQLRRAGIQ